VAGGRVLPDLPPILRRLQRRRGRRPGRIRAHLPDLAWLGVDALWISPFYRSPMVDFGYDISDYATSTRASAPWGSSTDCWRRPTPWDPGDHRLGAQPHLRPAPWFVDARSGTASAHRSWYVWRDPRPDGRPPNNWVAAFDLSAPTWTFDEATGQWYLHLFESAQPDLNWTSPRWCRPCTTCSASG